MEQRFEKTQLPKLIDFNSLIHLAENRTINEKRIPAIVKAMIDGKYFPPIIISIYGELLEGQHRVAAAKEIQKLNPDFGLNYVVIDPKDFGMTSIEIIILINTNFALWKQNDYISSRSSEVYDCRAITLLQSFCTSEFNYSLPATSSKLLLCGRRPTKEVIMAGKLQLTEEDLITAQNIFVEIYPLYDRYSFRLTTSFIENYVRYRKIALEKKISITSFINGIERKLDKFKTSNDSQFPVIFSDILRFSTIESDDIF